MCLPNGLPRLDSGLTPAPRLVGSWVQLAEFADIDQGVGIRRTATPIGKGVVRQRVDRFSVHVLGLTPTTGNDGYSRSSRGTDASVKLQRGAIVEHLNKFPLNYAPIRGIDWMELNERTTLAPAVIW